MTVKEMKRLVADDGKILSNGQTIAPVIDCLVEEADNWREIDDTEVK